MKDSEKRLQELAEALPFTRGRFNADDVRERAGQRPPRRWSWRLAAAAALLLAASHGGAYLLGHRRALPPAPPPFAAGPIAEGEDLLLEAARLDPEIPVEELRDRLTGLRRGIHLANLPQRLRSVDDLARRPRAEQLADALTQLDVAFDQVRDPGFLGLVVARIARESLEGAPAIRFLPSTAHGYARVTPVGGGRYRVFFVDASGGEPRVIADEGTLPELRGRHDEIEFKLQGE